MLEWLIRYLVISFDVISKSFNERDISLFKPSLSYNY